MTSPDAFVATHPDRMLPELQDLLRIPSRLHRSRSCVRLSSGGAFSHSPVAREATRGRNRPGGLRRRPVGVRVADRSRGSLPIVAELGRQDTEVAMAGIALPDRSLHAPNEGFDITQLFTGVQVFTRFFQLTSTPPAEEHA